MSERAALLTGRQLALWSRIHDDEVRANPDSGAAVVRSAAWRRFQGLCWTLDTRAGPGAITQHEYEGFDAGPDLTALARTRYLAQRKRERARVQRRHLSGYNIYLQLSLREHKADWADLPQPERITRVAAAWNAMSKEEKASYTVVE
jgi:hypothetical protein